MLCCVCAGRVERPHLHQRLHGGARGLASWEPVHCGHRLHRHLTAAGVCAYVCVCVRVRAYMCVCLSLMCVGGCVCDDQMVGIYLAKTLISDIEKARFNY